MVRILVFIMVFSKFMKNSYNKLILVSIIFFTNINISFLNQYFDHFSIIAQKSQSNQEQCSLCCSSRSSCSEVFLRKGVLKICSKFTGEHPCWSVISTKLQSSWKGKKKISWQMAGIWGIPTVKSIIRD